LEPPGAVFEPAAADFAVGSLESDVGRLNAQVSRVLLVVGRLMSGDPVLRADGGNTEERGGRRPSRVCPPSRAPPRREAYRASNRLRRGSARRSRWSQTT